MKREENIKLYVFKLKICSYRTTTMVPTYILPAVTIKRYLM